MGENDKRIDDLTVDQKDQWDSINKLRSEFTTMAITQAEIVTRLAQIQQDIQTLVSGDGSIRCVRHADAMEQIAESLKETRDLTKQHENRISELEKYKMKVYGIAIGVGSVTSLIGYLIQLYVRTHGGG